MASFSDDFNRANGAIGGSWTVLTGQDTPQIVSNAVEDGDGSGAGAVHNTVLATAHEFVITLSDAGNEAGVELWTRLTDEGVPSGYIVYFYRGGTESVWYVEGGRYDNGSFVGMTSGGESLSIPSLPCTLKLESIGSTHKVYVNGVEEMSWSHSGYVGGRVGFLMYHTTASMRIDAAAGADIGGSPTPTDKFFQFL